MHFIIYAQIYVNEEQNWNDASIWTKFAKFQFEFFTEEIQTVAVGWNTCDIEVVRIRPYDELT